MATNDEKIDRLNDAFNQKTNTRGSRNHWQEPLERFTSVPAEKSNQAASAVKGISGSWAAFYGRDYAGRDELKALTGPPIQEKVNRLGLPGVPEINFTPYCYETNRFGTKGPSLLGHPISFSVVGPTMKSHSLGIQWEITDNTGTANGDIFTISADGIFSPTGGPGVAPSTTTISEVYGGLNLADFAGGLYLVITATGAQGTVDGFPGGLGDSFIYEDSGTYEAISQIDDNSKFEIFRIVDIGSDFFEIDPNKRVSSYFNIPGAATPVCRSIMVFEPHATRLKAIPDSGSETGRERVFLTTIPETSANSDYMPPYQGSFGPGDGTWVNGGFDFIDPSDGTGANTNLYNERAPLPCPIPLAQKSGQAQRLAGVPVPIFPSVGEMNILVDASDVDTNDVGKIIHIYDFFKKGDSELQALPGGQESEESFLGWFEVLSVDNVNNVYTLRRIAEVDPKTGKISFGLPQALVLDNNSSVTDRLFLKFTVHDTVTSVHVDPSNDIDKIESIRLTNLIDPTWVERSPKTTIKGSSPARADRAVFDTSSSGFGAAGTNADPGSLLDLGFRMVLYPAQESPFTLGEVIPDWDNPILSNEVTLDPSITDEEQFITIDYSSGAVILSHEPVPGAGCDIAPNGIINPGFTNGNPRGEIILFACCVPFSKEEGQLGVGGRLRAGLLPEELDSREIVDAYSERVFVPVDVKVNGADQNVESGFNLTLDLRVDQFEDPLPPTGYIEIVRKTTEGLPVFTTTTNFTRASTFGYQGKTYNTDSDTGEDYVQLQAVHGGSDVGTFFNAFSDGEFLAVLRRDVYGPNEDDGSVGTDYQYDTTYGFSKRNPSVQFQEASLDVLIDGSTSVKFPKFDQHQNTFKDAFSTWLLSGAEVTAGSGLFVDIAPSVLLAKGRRIEVVKQDRYLSPSSDNYIYFDVSNPNFPRVEVDTSMPVTDPDDTILLAKAVTDFSSVTSVVDLRSSLENIDLKLDILVGESPGYPQQGISHFDTLGEAISYIGEISDPTTGPDGSYFRIKVVGFTNETDTITLPVSGVVVEGAAIRRSGTESHGIRFDFDTDNLFDLNGQSDWVFRDLQFEYVDVGHGANTDPSQRNLFSGGCTKFYFDNVYFEGNGVAHGFYYGDTGDTISGNKFQRCDIQNVTDFGFYFDSGSLVTQNVFDSCYLEDHNSSPVTTLLDPSAFRFPDGVSSAENKVLNCDIRYFDTAIRTLGHSSFFKNNTISLTRIEAINAFSNSVVTTERNYFVDNYLSLVYTNSPGGSKSGILIQGDSCVIRGNYVTLATPSAGDYGFLIRGTANRFTENTCLSGDVHFDDTGDNNIISNNFIGANGGLYIRSNDTIISNNEILGSEQISDTIYGSTETGYGLGIDSDHCQVIGNKILEGVKISELAGTNTIFSNNIVGSSTNTVSLYIENQGHTLNKNIIYGNIDASNGGGGQVFIIDNQLLANSAQDIDIGGSLPNSEISRNYLNQGDILSTSLEAIISENTLESGSITESGGGRVHIIDNTLKGAGNLSRTGSGENGIIRGNILVGDLTVGCNEDIVSENRVGGSASITGNEVQVLGNNIENDLDLDGDDCEASSNRILTGDLNATASSPLITSNRVVSGSIVLTSSSTEATVSHNIVNANIDIQASLYLIVGNRMANIVNTGGSGPGDPDSSQGILVANKYTGGATPEFGGVPSSGTGAKDNNIF